MRRRLKIWAAAEPFGNHTYGHLNLNTNPAEAFEREIDENEPALELLAAKDANWHWLRYPFLHEGETVEKRRAVRAYLQAHGYRVAQVTLDWEDYLWNSAYARCVAKNDAQSIAWLKSSYLSIESSYLDLGQRSGEDWCTDTTSITCCCCIWARSAARFCRMRSI